MRFSAVICGLVRKSRDVYCPNHRKFIHNYENPLFRRPIKILNANESENRLVPISKLKKTNNQVLPATFQRDEGVIRTSGNVVAVPLPSYEKLKDDDERFAKTLLLLKSQKEREKTGNILLEGVRLINDAITAGIKCKTLYFSNEATLAKIVPQKFDGVNIYKVLYRKLQVWSSLKTCPGVMGVFKKPSLVDLTTLNEPAIPVTVFCINVQDHETLGAIVRCAAAAGCKSVITTKGCIDVWMHKVLRSGCGGHFHVPIISDVHWTHALNYIPKEASVYLLDNENESVAKDDDKFTPFYFDEEVESEETKYTEVTEDNETRIVDESYEDSQLAEKYENVPLQQLVYHDVTFPKQDIVLCVEGNARDPRTTKLMCDFGGQKLHIPTDNNTKQLQCSLSLPVVLYEIRRQFEEKYIA